MRRVIAPCGHVPQKKKNLKFSPDLTGFSLIQEIKLRSLRYTLYNKNKALLNLSERRNMNKGSDFKRK